MGKVTVTEFVSADGIMENPAWTFPYWNDTIAAFKDAELNEADALLLGRTTYQEFAAVWPDHPGEDDASKAQMNDIPKHVATTTLTELEWNATRIEGDVAEGIRALKAEKNLLVMGSGSLVEFLRSQGLVDEYRLAVYPVLVGSGRRLFDSVEAQATLDLRDCKVLDNGVLLLVYSVVSDTVAVPDFD
ncbi:dihydrofolate reductase family protein [Rhodococcus sp. SJ]|uniref:dihydrofolate reductase family protein n=1 Tax=Rhodococcus sp. SJ TaxID=3434112 RepID=UPI003D7B9A31